MFHSEVKKSTGLLVAGLMVALGSLTGPIATAGEEKLDKAFEALKTYDWGTDRSVLKPIDEAIVASHKDTAAKKSLEMRLVAALKGNVSQAAKDYICRQLSLIGSAGCVPAVAELLTDEKLSHMARYALERIPDEEAVAALRDALPKTSGKVKVGVINSLGVRRDAKSVEALTALLKDQDGEIASAAAAALGAIGTPEAAKALTDFQAKAPEKLQLAAADACLVCAERLAAAGNKAEALALYKLLAKSEIKHVKLAATRGMLALAGKKEKSEEKK